MRPATRSQRGETLVGLLVGMALGLFVLAAGSAMLAQLLRAHQQSLQGNQQTQDLDLALDMLTRELQNAQSVGQSDAAHTRSSLRCPDPFCDGPEDFSVGPNELLFSLDRNRNGVQDNNECSGWRVKDGALQVRTACAPAVWTALTDTRSLRMTGLQVRVQCTPINGWLQRQVQVLLQARTVDNAARSLDRESRVNLRNPMPLSQQSRACP